jgi:hypothetical protein
MTTTREKTFSVGRYLVSPLTRLTQTGCYAPSVSIRSGQGQASHDRVYRFTRLFSRQEQALAYALGQARQWLHTGLPA